MLQKFYFLKTFEFQAKMDQMNSRCVIQWSQQRRFDNQQWHILSQRLQEWMANLKSVKHYFILQSAFTLLMTFTDRSMVLAISYGITSCRVANN